MKQTAILSAVLLLLISPALGVVGHNDTSSQMGVTSTSSSASGTTAVGPNGTQYSAKVSMSGRTQNNTEEDIRSETFSSSKVEFNGTIRAGTPCHVIDHEISETEDGYIMNIKTVKDELDNQACIQTVTGINYNAELEAEPGFTLEVQHNNQTVKTFNTVSDKEGKNKSSNEDNSILRQFLDLLGL